MKRIVFIAIAIIMILTSFVACNQDNDIYQIDKSYDSRTAAFYGHINENQYFWFDMDYIQEKETYKFIQATNGKNVTTILDYEDNSRDSYVIAVKGENAALVHTLRFAEKKYDTTIAEEFQDFLFGGENPQAFSEPNWSGDAEFEGTTYYCEMFEVASSEGGEINGTNKYYFDEGRLVAVEIAENDKVTMTMKFNEYGIEVPDHIYLTPPSDFEKGTIIVESVIDYNSMGWAEQ